MHDDKATANGAATRTLIGLLQCRAATFADKRAFAFVSGQGEEVALTYGALDERARAIGGYLQGQAPAGSRALLLYPPGLDFITAFFGCLYAGIVAVPVAPPGRKHFAWSAEPIFEAAKPSLVLSTARNCAEAAQTYAPQTLLDRAWIATDTIADDCRHAWRDLQLDGRQTAFLQYTSGSTSAPKGVMLSHENLLHNAALIEPAFGNTPQSSAVFWLPLYHDMGLIGGVIQPLYCGGSCTLLAPADFLQRPGLWLETISRIRATVSGGPDFAFDLCARKIRPEDRAGLDLSSWQIAFVGAERVRAQTLERFAAAFAPCGFRKTAFFPCYGLAEATLMVSGGPRQTGPMVVHVDGGALGRNQVAEVAPETAGARSLVGCGQNLPGQRLAIVDPQTACPCAEGAVGEIWVQGPSVAGGYYDQPEATRRAFAARLAPGGQGPFLRTGDFGFLRSGQLFVTGRLKDLIIIRGRNFYPEDIEHSAERAYEGLRAGHCAAFSVEQHNREWLVIIQEIEPRHRRLDAERALRAIRYTVAARHDLEVYAIVLVNAGTIPKTSSGKTRRSECRRRYMDGQLAILAEWTAELRDIDEDDAGGHLAPRGDAPRAAEIEAWLIERIATRMRLPREQVHADTPFLEFGMSSLSAVEIAADLERWLNRPLSPTAIYNYPTISALAGWLAGAGEDVSPAFESPAAAWSAAEVDPQRLHEEVRRMSDEQVEAFITKEMAKLRSETVHHRRP